MSMAGAQAAEAQHQAATTPGYYNLELGPTYWNFGTGFGVQYESNINLTETNRRERFYLHPANQHADALACFGQEQP